MKLDIFIEGEVIDLCIPTLEFAQTSDWYAWFNDSRVTPYLEHGVFPNTREKQIEFFEREKDKRIIFIIMDKYHEAIGTVSINYPNFQKKCADIGLVMNVSKIKNPLSSLEAIALVTQHSFSKLGLKRTNVGHHIGLIPWSHLLSLIGYRLEGITRNSFVKGEEVTDSLIGACQYNDYKTIIQKRNGKLWDSSRLMLQRIKKLPKKPIHKELQEFFEQHNQYYEEIFSL